MHAIRNHADLRVGGMPALSPRENQIVILVARGLKNKDIAQELLMSKQNVKNHLHHIFNKLGVHSRTQLAIFYTAEMSKRMPATNGKTSTMS